MSMNGISRGLLKAYEAMSLPQHVKISSFDKTINGQLKLSGSTVNEAFQINGDCTAKNVTFTAPLEINGSANLSHSTFLDQVLIRGTPNISFCDYKKALELLASKVSLESCTAPEIYMTSPVHNKNFLFSQIQKTLDLKNSTVDRVHFNEPGGKVKCCPQSSVKNVINGQIIKNL